MSFNIYVFGNNCFIPIRLTDLGGVGRKVSRDHTAGGVRNLSSPKGEKLRRSHSMSEIASELGVNLLSEVSITI